jgi:hypothetical protein
MDLGKPQKRLSIERELEQLPATEPAESAEPLPVTAPDDSEA